MSPSALSVLLLAVVTAPIVLAQPDPADSTPLYSKHYAYPSGIPYQVDFNTAALRGPQIGYNVCNSTTENQESLCQTSFANHIDDFCLWAPLKPNSTIGDTEGQVVAWCTKRGHGTRLIPKGALRGVQVIRAPNYVQFVGFIDQTLVNLAASDYGGELDPHGADLRGNPLGGLMYSNAFPSNDGNNNSYQQVSDWTNFIGGNAFCMKVCDPSGHNQAQLCQNIYDRLGCAYNVPNKAKNGTFEVCDGDDMPPPGVYTSSSQTLTYYQPPESLGPITSVPYTPAVPASSNCVTFQSTNLYPDLPTPTGGIASSATRLHGSAGATRLSSAGAAASTSNGASAVGVSSAATIASVVLVALFLSWPQIA